MKFDLKVYPHHFSRIKDGSMNFFVVDNDNGIQLGDHVRLKEYDPSPINPTALGSERGFTDAEPLDFRVGYIYSLGAKNVVFSLLPIKTAPKAKKAAKV